MREPSRSTDTSERGRQWRGELRRFRACDPRRSGLQLGLTLLLFLAGSYAALRLGARSWWQGTLLGLAVSPLWVRLFILQHDLGHGSLFRSRRLCHVLGSLLGVITMTPFFRWRKTHAAHHATSGNLDERRPDRDIFTMTVAEYRAAPAWTRAWYRAFRHPLVLFGVVPSFVFMLEQRFAYGPHVRWRERASTWLTNVCWLGIGIALQRTVGLSVALRVIAPMVAGAGGSGIWLFYVQHQFPNAYWQPKRSWRFDDASLLGSSYLRLPAVLRWLTANIGLHHVHHLDPLIPNYRLREAHASQPALAAVPTFGLADAWRLTPVDLWDEQTGRMVRFAELERDPRGDFVAATRAYRADVLSALRACSGWTEAAKNATRAATQRLRQARRDLLSPSLPLALWTSFKTIAFVLGPLLLADRLWQHGAAWATVPLLLVAGMACYGAVAVVHDLAHGSFLRSRRLNDAVGYLVAPLLLMQYGGFKRSHLGHHRHSQSTADPKRFGATHSPEANAPGYRTLDHSEPFLKLPVRLGHAVASFPPRVRQFLYLCVAPVFIGPAVIFFGGEFSVVRRNFRLRESWLATAQSLAWGALLYTWSPSLLGLFAVSLLIGYSFVFYVFAAHLSPNQVYWTSERRTEPADALNVSDVSCGALLRWLGNGFSDHHSTHHLSPSVPCYRLARAARLVTPELAQLRAPALDLLDPEACAVLYGNYFRAIVQTNAEAWDYTEHGALRNLAPPGP